MYCVLNKQEKKALHGRNIGELDPFAVGIPLVDCSDSTLEEIYYFRWHTFCKHIRPTPEGWVVTEFYPEVRWAGKYNTISCPAGHHFYEGRWLYDGKFLESYANFWFTPEAEPRKYSFWAADSIFAIGKVSGDFSVAEGLYEALKENFTAWKREKLQANGLYHQICNYDGMEYSAGGSGCRPTLNSYQYGDAVALSAIAHRLGKEAEAAAYAREAEDLRQRINTLLWDEDACFYKTLDETLTPMREQIGYVPWYFGVPDDGKSGAWRYLNDEHHFFAPYGPTTVERCWEGFMEEHPHECLWNGPSWPFATSQTLTAMGNLLCDYSQDTVNKSDYFKLLKQYAACHYLTEDGKTVPFIDENLHPFTGRWLARDILKAHPKPNQARSRGKDYNHSTFCDLVLTGLAGLRPREDNLLRIEPLLTEEDLDYFCADGILYHGKSVCVLWDRDGNRYGKGAGFRVFADENEIYSAPTPTGFTKAL